MATDIISERKRKFLKLRANTDLFIEKVLGDRLEDFQRDICKMFNSYDRLNIKACHAVGKTWLMGRIALAFLYTYKGAKVITTAPTFRQVVTLLWGEIRKAKKNSKFILDGKLLTNKIEIDDDWFAIGFSPDKSAQSDTKEQQGSSFQGFHAKYILIIFDEATGISRDIYTMAEGLMTSGVVVKWVCIANPTTRASEFFKNTKLAEWYTHTINCFNSPNMIANGFTDKRKIQQEIDLLRSLSDEERLTRIKNYAKPSDYLINAQWVISKIFQWGFDHPLTKSKIFGEFPATEDNTIIKYDSLLNAFNRELPEDTTKPRFIGVDVARFGDDLTCFTELQNNKFVERQMHSGKRTTEIVGLVIAMIKSRDIGMETHVVVDGTGLGAGVVDGLEEALANGLLGPHVKIYEVHFAQQNWEVIGTTPEQIEEYSKNYANLKAFMFFQLDVDLRDCIDLEHAEIYEEELPVILFTYSSHGKMIVESKDDFKSRHGKSPDASDSIALANLGKYLTGKYGSFLELSERFKSPVFSKRPESKKGRTESRIKIREN